MFVFMVKAIETVLFLVSVYAIAESFSNYSAVWGMKRKKKLIIESGAEYDLRDIAQMNEWMAGVRNYARLMLFIAMVAGLLTAHFAMI